MYKIKKILKNALGSCVIVFALVLLVPSYAFGAQMDVHIASDMTEILPSYKFLRVININYENGGILADLLTGKQSEISFSVDSKTSDISQLLEKINSNLQDVSSKVTVYDVTIHYKSILISNEQSTSIEYNIELIPTIKDYNFGGASSIIIDSHWRGIKITGPVIIDTEEFGEFDINNPESALQVIAPQVLDEIKKTDAIHILNIPLLDASGILNLPLHYWHFLFDPTAILVETKDFDFQGDGVVSYYTMGECKIGIGPCEDRIWKQDFTIDKKYKLISIESQDDATISIEGYVSYRDLIGVEVFVVSADKPDIGRTATGEFPISVIYGMAGMAGIGTIVILTFSSRKLKKEVGMGQTGIAPSQLRAQTTSASSGSYQTNRVEGHLFEKRSPV